MSERALAATHDRRRSVDAETAQHDVTPLQRRLAVGTGAMPTLPGVATTSSVLPIQMFADAVGAGVHSPIVQFDGDGGGLTSDAVHRAAAHGMSGSGGTLPHLAAIQRSFGRHDVSGVSAHVGGRAAEGSAAMGARAYASGNAVAFASSPDLHLAAHEAAHVVQQRGGVQLSGGVGVVGDVYERHADGVADLVTRGESAETLLDEHAPTGGGGTGIQRAVQRDGTDDHVSGGEASSTMSGHSGRRRLGPATPITGERRSLNITEPGPNLVRALSGGIVALAGLEGGSQQLDVSMNFPLAMVGLPAGRFSIRLSARILHERASPADGHTESAPATYQVRASIEVGAGFVLPGVEVTALIGASVEAHGVTPEATARMFCLSLEHAIRATNEDLADAIFDPTYEARARASMVEGDSAESAATARITGAVGTPPPLASAPPLAAGATAPPSARVTGSAGGSDHWRVSGADGATEASYRMIDIAGSVSVDGVGGGLSGSITAHLPTGHVEGAPEGSITIQVRGRMPSTGANAAVSSILASAVGFLISAIVGHDEDTSAALEHARRIHNMVGDIAEASGAAFSGAAVSAGEAGRSGIVGEVEISLSHGHLSLHVRTGSVARLDVLDQTVTYEHLVDLPVGWVEPAEGGVCTP